MKRPNLQAEDIFAWSKIAVDEKKNLPGAGTGLGAIVAMEEVKELKLLFSGLS